MGADPLTQVTIFVTFWPSKVHEAVKRSPSFLHTLTFLLDLHRTGSHQVRADLKVLKQCTSHVLQLSYALRPNIVPCQITFIYSLAGNCVIHLNSGLIIIYFLFPYYILFAGQGKSGHRPTGTRTRDLRLSGPLLFRLSYGPGREMRRCECHFNQARPQERCGAATILSKLPSKELRLEGEASHEFKNYIESQ